MKDQWIECHIYVLPNTVHYIRQLLGLLGHVLFGPSQRGRGLPTLGGEDLELGQARGRGRGT